MTVEPDDDKVRAAFASLKAESAAHFPPPPANELIMRGPAALRRRRLVSLAAVVGACTAVTAGGFAVAQTIGPIAFGPEPAGNGNSVAASSQSDESSSHLLGDPASPHADEDESPATEAAVPPETALVITDAGKHGDTCAPGTLGLYEDWTFADETPWAIDAGSGPLQGDVNGDGADDVIAVLECRPEGADALTAGVAAFSWNDDGTSLEQLGWVWLPHTADASAEVTAVADGVITVDAEDPASAERTGEFRYTWDPAAGAFAPVVEESTAEPSPGESTGSPTPVETPTTQESPASTPSGS